MILNYAEKLINVKIVYYGPAMSGKTTSLKFLFNHFGKENELESIESTIGRTLFFDFGVLQFQGNEWSLKLLLYTATGQDYYAGTRPATLNGVDGIIFVADSQLEHLAHNLISWNELKIMFGNDIYEIPIVIALNKYDLHNVEKLNEDMFIENIDFEKFKQISLKKTIAIQGKGVLDSFNEIINFIMRQLAI